MNQLLRSKSRLAKWPAVVVCPLVVFTLAGCENAAIALDDKDAAVLATAAAPIRTTVAAPIVTTEAGEEALRLQVATIAIRTGKLDKAVAGVAHVDLNINSPETIMNRAQASEASLDNLLDAYPKVRALMEKNISTEEEMAEIERSIELHSDFVIDYGAHLVEFADLYASFGDTSEELTGDTQSLTFEPIMEN